MKTIVIASLLALMTLIPVSAAEGWMTDFEAAKKKAADEKKALLIDFTGSDWCHWCVKLKEEVFDTEAFAKGVADDFVLVELDFPQDKTLLSKELTAQNEKLADQYKIRGFPTIYLTDPQGRPIGKTGYEEGGPEAYLALLATFREKLAIRDKALATAEATKGKERAVALEEALAAVPPESLKGFYNEEFEELAKTNPKAELIVVLNSVEAAAKQRQELNTLAQGGKLDELLTRVDAIIKEQQPKGEELQQLLAYKVGSYVQQKKFMDAVGILDAVIMIDEKSDYGESAKEYKMGLLVMQAEHQKAEANQAGNQIPPVSTAVKVPPQVIAEEPAEAGKKKPAREEDQRVQPEAKGIEALKKELAKAREAHKTMVEAVNASHDEFEKLGKELVGKRVKLKEMTQAITKFTQEVRGLEGSLADVERAHNQAHEQEIALKKAIAAHELELVRRKEIADLEKEARELSKKAEALRKKAEELKD